MRTFRYKQNRLQQLKGFCAVVEARSVSKAANRLSLTQPTVSLQVQSLERDLHATLFERRGPKIELTFEGELLYELARPLVEGLTALDAGIMSSRAGFESRPENLPSTTCCHAPCSGFRQNIRESLLH